MLELFHKGGVIMWPLLGCSLITLTVVFERLMFVIVEKSRRSPDTVLAMINHLSQREPAHALRAGEGSSDFVARVLSHALGHREQSVSNAVLHASSTELDRFNRGLTVLDTVITLAPLLGLLGTVTGMIRTFGLLGGAELGAPQAVTGGIAEALIATAFGLSIAITALIPFNFLNAGLEKARREIEAAVNQLELHLK